MRAFTVAAVAVASPRLSVWLEPSADQAQRLAQVVNELEASRAQNEARLLGGGSFLSAPSVVLSTEATGDGVTDNVLAAVRAFDAERQQAENTMITNAIEAIHARSFLTGPSDIDVRVRDSGEGLSAERLVESYLHRRFNILKRALQRFGSA